MSNLTNQSITMVENSGGSGGKCFPARWNVAVKPCDSCRSASALLFCRKDSAFLCMACDVKLHSHTKHERVWMCEVCEQAPACVTCKADAAALCVTCDRDIHSANPLARRHERIPVVPFYESAETVVNSSACNLLAPAYGSTVLNSSAAKEGDDSWRIPRDTANINVEFPSDTPPVIMKPLDLLSAADRLFDFGFTIPSDVRLESQFLGSVNDGVVPVQTTAPTKNFKAATVVDHESPGTRNEFDFTKCVTSSYNKSSSQSHSHSFQVSSSSMDASVVPEENSMLDISKPYMIPVNGREYFTKKAKQFSAMDREARVLRYREKRKNRKFEKKIRYASRKAYAEMRPRIKGRFAKRTESTTELDVDRWLFTAESNTNSYGAEVEYGVVPSF